jgi:antitoxin ParD1/3/4
VVSVFQEVSMTVKTSISLTDEQESYARSLVNAGRYSSLSAVLQQGLEMLRRDNETRDAEIAGLRALIDQRRSAGFVSLEESEREIDAMLERKRRDRAAL